MGDRWARLAERRQMNEHWALIEKFGKLHILEIVHKQTSEKGRNLLNYVKKEIFVYW